MIIAPSVRDSAGVEILCSVVSAAAQTSPMHALTLVVAKGSEKRGKSMHTSQLGSSVSVAALERGRFRVVAAIILLACDQSPVDLVQSESTLPAEWSKLFYEVIAHIRLGQKLNDYNLDQQIEDSHEVHNWNN